MFRKKTSSVGASRVIPHFTAMGLIDIVSRDRNERRRTMRASCASATSRRLGGVLVDAKLQFNPPRRTRCGSAQPKIMKVVAKDLGGRRRY